MEWIFESEIDSHPLSTSMLSCPVGKSASAGIVDTVKRQPGVPAVIEAGCIPSIGSKIFALEDSSYPPALVMESWEVSEERRITEESSELKGNMAGANNSESIESGSGASSGKETDELSGGLVVDWLLVCGSPEEVPAEVFEIFKLSEEPPPQLIVNEHRNSIKPNRLRVVVLLRTKICFLFAMKYFIWVN